MALNFPLNPNINDEYTFSNKTWIWNGIGWIVKIQTISGGIDSASITTLIDSNYVSLRSAHNGVFFENNAHVTLDYTIATGNNAMSAGPITIDSDVTVTIPTGSYWTIV